MNDATGKAGVAELRRGLVRIEGDDHASDNTRIGGHHALRNRIARDHCLAVDVAQLGGDLPAQVRDDSGGLA